MSQMLVRTQGFSDVKLNVLSFMSPIFASTASNQTQSSEQHHPIRCQQPNIRFDVMFRSEKEWEAWQTFNRQIQLQLLQGQDPNNVAVCTFYWPERNINNWTGIIAETEGGAEPFNWTPHTTIDVTIIKGLVATQAALWSYGTDFAAIYGGDKNTIPAADVLLSPPDTASNPLNIGTGAQLDSSQLLGTQASALAVPGNLSIGNAGSLSPSITGAGTPSSITNLITGGSS